MIYFDRWKIPKYSMIKSGIPELQYFCFTIIILNIENMVNM